MRPLWVLAAVIAAAVVISAAGRPAIAAPPASPEPGLASEPAAMPDRPDLQARNFFQAGRYADALSIYQRLYTETHHPTYLRNIARCQQMLREPKPAIESFQAYLREARSLDPGERTEIEGYVAEMQRLEVTAPAATASADGSAAQSGTPSWSPGTTATVSAQSSPPITHKWWFWTGLGALAAAGVIAIVAASGGKDRLPCPSGAVCPP